MVFIENDHLEAKNQAIYRCIRTPIQSKMIITGPPGSGKTYVTVERIKFLIENYQLETPNAILVLSFTRNAVREIKTRLRSKDSTKYENVTVQSFDQFAFRLILNTKIDPESIELSNYERNIKLATKIIREKCVMDEEEEIRLYDLDEFEDFFKIKHIIIDEVQDLSLNRAELVWELFQCLSEELKEWGFTLLGDSDQEIFAYLERTASEDARFKRSIDFLSTVKEWVGDKDDLELQEIELNTDLKYNKRFMALNNRVLDSIQIVRDVIHKNRDENKVDRQSHIKIKMALPKSQEIDDVESFIETIYHHKDMKTALLFRSNKTALYTSALLYKNSYLHQYQLRNSKRIYPNWIGYVISIAAEGGIIKKSNSNFILRKTEFLDKWQELKPSEDNKLNPQKIWGILSYIVSDRHQSDLSEISLSILRTNLVRLFDESLMREFGFSESNLIVSTIHKSKGREYDIVFCENFQTRLDKVTFRQLQNENRIIYVALTRCKHDFFLLNLIKDPDGKQFRLDSPKNLIKGFTKDTVTQILENRRNIGLTVEASDFIDKSSFLTKKIDIATERQHYIWNHIEIGDEIIIELSLSENKNWNGAILHKKNQIGNLTDKFCKKIGKTLKKIGRTNYKILGGKIVALTTEIISSKKEYTDLKNKIPWKYSDLGIWLGFRIMGIFYIQN